jgi:hypothetical protein
VTQLERKLVVFLQTIRQHYELLKRLAEAEHITSEGKRVTLHETIKIEVGYGIQAIDGVIANAKQEQMKSDDT